MTTLDRLSKAFDELVDDLVALTESLPVRWINNHSGGFVIIAPDYVWGERTLEQEHSHLQLSRRFAQIVDLLNALLVGAPDSLLTDFVDSQKKFKIWVDLSSNWSLTQVVAENTKHLRESAANLRHVLDVLAAAPKDRTILIADTNSLLAEAAPEAYRTVCGVDSFEFVLLPTVLQELDELKVTHRNPDVREKAQKVITRIKGWRTQGSLLNGVKIDKTIVVRAVHQEPDFSKSLSWLDSSNADDRIVASVMQIQAISPSARVLLATGDINLQNKADAALIETVEFKRADSMQ